MMLILAAMIGLAGAFIYGAKQISGKSYGDGVVQLAGKSVLSEFDLNLKKDYGLLAFYGQGQETAGKIKGYTDVSLRAEDDLKIRNITVNFAEQNLQNLEITKKEIVDYMKTEIWKNKAEEKSAEEKNPGARKNRVLRNRAIINRLPSAALGKNPVSFAERLESLKDTILSIDSLMKEGSENYLINEYILQHFNHALVQNSEKETFFAHEVEYVLEGDYSNERNKKAVANDLTVFRSILNAEYLYTDPKKKGEIMAAAEALTPGAMAVLTQAAIVASWSLAEGENDVDLLQAGKKVPMIKDENSWAVDLESVLQNVGRDCIDPGTEKGMVYGDYLRCLLFLEEESTKIARVLDLIQINIKGTYNGMFQIDEYNTGMRIGAEINGSEREYNEQY